MFRPMAELNEYGSLAADERCLTRTPGLFAAGDCRRKTLRQVVTAAADGAIAGYSAARYIDENF